MEEAASSAVKPIVAIVGRPNVGKSTLFNRLVGGRVAIVEDIPGTTRDRLYGDAEWREREFTVVDTGGLEMGARQPLAEAVRKQIETAIEEADLLVFVVDVRDGVTPADEEIADVVRRAGKPTVLAVNKVDDLKHEAEAQQFYRLGIEDLVPLSAYHATGVGDLLDWIAAHFPPVVGAPAQPEYLKVAIVGRPNVGKSALLNAILGQERAIVSDIPGTTRDVIDTAYLYNDQHLVLIDTAGIRRRGRIDRGIEKYSTMRALRAINRADVVILVLDATELIAAQDTHIAGYARDAYKSMVVAVNKWDLAPEMGLTADQCALEVRSRLKFVPDVPILFVSAQTGRGVKEVLEAVLRVGADRAQRVPTSTLNQVISQAVLAHAPASVRGRPLKILYVTQAAVDPPTFVFFVNDPELLHFSYRRYLENKLREAFGFAGTPLKLIFRSRREE